MVTNPNAPPGTTAQFQITSPFTDTLTTNQSDYSAGEPVQMTFTMTNTSDEPASVVWGAVNDGFIVTQGNQVVWQSNSGVNPQFLVNDTVQPGKSLTFPGTWDGTVASDSTATTLTGSFVVTNQLDPSVSASFQIGAPFPRASTYRNSLMARRAPRSISFTRSPTTAMWVSNSIWHRSTLS